MIPNYKILQIGSDGVNVEIDFGIEMFDIKVPINKPDKPLEYKDAKTSKQTFRFPLPETQEPQAFKSTIDQMVLQSFQAINKPEIDQSLLSLVGEELIADSQLQPTVTEEQPTEADIVPIVNDIIPADLIEVGTLEEQPENNIDPQTSEG